MTQRDLSDCTAIWIRGYASANGRAHLTVELIRPGRRPLETHELELVAGDCDIGALLELINA